MASKKELALTREQVLEVLELGLPESVFYWRVSTSNRVKVGSKAGYLHKQGYTVIRINGNYFFAHRLVWFVAYGKFPDNMIDHVNGDKSDNRIENLRDVTNKVNHQNMPKQNRRDVDLPTGVRVGYRNKIGEILGYTTHWQDMNGKTCEVYHGLKEYCTLEAALAAAKARREIEIENLKDQGAAYTNRHGVEND
jgi:hypothetical protein